METLKPNTPVSTMNALEAALKLLERKSAQKAEVGACLWIDGEGKRYCFKLTPEDCEKIPGLIYIGGPCKDIVDKIKV
jgi:hypothetical protein